MRRAFCTLILAVACLITVPPSAGANPPPRYGVYYAPAPVYRPVYVYPQIVTTPYYGFPYYPSWSAGYLYSPGYYNYSYSPFWGPSYYYTNPSYYSWYWIR
jgi:hypothetical protein